MSELAALPLAHAGHWVVQVAYFLPVVAFLAWLAVTTLRERGRERERDDHERPEA